MTLDDSGMKVVVITGEWHCSDGSRVGKGDVGWVIGHVGLNTAVVHFDTDAGGKTADVPSSHLRILTPPRGRG